MQSAHFSSLDLTVHKAPIAPGIYRLFNKITGMSYVGQASNLHNRLGIHLKQLKQRSHSQRKLGAAFTKHNAESWRFEILELCTRTQLTDREMHYATAYKALVCGYNSAPIKSGVEVTDEFREIARQAWAKIRATMTAEQRSAVAKRAAETRRTRAAAARRSEASKKAWATRRNSTTGEAEA